MLSWQKQDGLLQKYKGLGCTFFPLSQFMLVIVVSPMENYPWCRGSGDVLLAFWLWAFPRDNSSGLTKGISVIGQQWWSQSMGSPCPPPLCLQLIKRVCSCGFVDCACLTWLLSAYLFSALGAGRVILSEWCRVRRAHARGSCVEVSLPAAVGLRTTK